MIVTKPSPEQQSGLMGLRPENSTLVQVLVHRESEEYKEEDDEENGGSGMSPAGGIGELKSLFSFNCCDPVASKCYSKVEKKKLFSVFGLLCNLNCISCNIFTFVYIYIYIKSILIHVFLF